MTTQAGAGPMQVAAPLVSHDERAASGLLLPLGVVLIGVTLIPIAYSFWTSLYALNLRRPRLVPFVGLDNYGAVLSSPAFIAAVARTASFTVMAVTAVSVIALLVALLLNQEFPGRRVLSACLLIPWAIPSVANGLMWKWIYDANYGALNGLLLQLGVIQHGMIWLGDPSRTLPLIANAFVWKEVPLAAILLLVNLKAIPADLHAAARVDGAPAWQRFRHVTLPALRPGFTLVAVYEAMVAVRHFDLFFLLTEGGPGNASDVVAWRVYVETFRNLNFGLGAAMAYILALATLLMSYGFIRALAQRV
ncbi:MAG: sugar ABC transporter permease [Acetobacteraceae bacterium]|nr:sugar ABC transporter permease [Acetobacteraceae bacterium]